MKRRIISYVLLMVLALALVGCASVPVSFVMVPEPSWAGIELKAGLSYEDAWPQVVDVLARKFELEMISKEGGYLRTSWIYTWWTGYVTANYRVRAVVKFSPDRKKVDIKTEANYLTRGRQWVVGTDTRLLKTVKMDIMGVVGRVTR